jgi:hypothetical protein
VPDVPRHGTVLHADALLAMCRGGGAVRHFQGNCR